MDRAEEDAVNRHNQSLKQRSDEARKSKAHTIDPSEKKFHQPNRPSI